MPDLRYENVMVASFPTDSLQVAVQVSKGQNLVLRSVGSYRSNYVTDKGVLNTTLVMQPNDSFSAEASSALLIFTNSPIQVALTKVDNSVMVININRMFFVDEELLSSKVVNIGTEEA